MFSVKINAIINFLHLTNIEYTVLFVTQWTVAHLAPLSMDILQARILEWVAMLSSRGLSQPIDQSQVSCIASGCFTI